MSIRKNKSDRKKESEKKLAEERENIGQCALCYRPIYEDYISWVRSYPSCFGVRICYQCEDMFNRKRIDARKSKC